jgi:hypothetical protein
VNVGDLISVNGQIATITSPCYTRVVYTPEDYDLQAAGYEGGTACSFVDVTYANGRQGVVNLSRTNWQFHQSANS